LIALLALGATLRPATGEDALYYAANNWIARCEAGVCKASLASGIRDEALLIGRWSGPSDKPAAGIAIGIATPHAIADRERPIDVRIDDKSVLTLVPGRDYAPLERVEAFWLTDRTAANTVVEAVLKGKRLRISYLDMVGAPHDADFNVEALTSVIAFMDDAQHIAAGSTTGVAPPQSVPHAPEMSRIDLIIRMGLPARLLARHARSSDCEDATSPKLKSVTPLIGALSKVAILYAIPCTASGSDITYRLWVIETGEIGGITPLYFALYDQAFGWKGSDLLFNVAFDAATTRLISTEKTTRASGCGHRAVWHWKNYAFQLDEFKLLPECAGGHAKIYPPT
jgi:hypothetical protein